MLELPAEAGVCWGDAGGQSSSRIAARAPTTRTRRCFSPHACSANFSSYTLLEGLSQTALFAVVIHMGKRTGPLACWALLNPKDTVTKQMRPCGGQGHNIVLPSTAEIRRITTEMSCPPDRVAIEIFETAFPAAWVWTGKRKGQMWWSLLSVGGFVLNPHFLVSFQRCPLLCSWMLFKLTLFKNVRTSYRTPGHPTGTATF